MRPVLLQAFSLAVAITHDFPGRLPRVVVHQAFSLSFDQHWLPVAYFFSKSSDEGCKIYNCPLFLYSKIPTIKRELPGR